MEATTLLPYYPIRTTSGQQSTKAKTNWVQDNYTGLKRHRKSEACGL